MGTKTSLAAALFPSVQRRVLALLFGEPGRSFQSGELIRLAKGGTGGVHRILGRLADAGWVTVARIGNQKHYRANRACVAFHELHGLVEKTMRGASASRKPAAAAAKARPAPVAEARPPARPAAEGWKTW